MIRFFWTILLPLSVTGGCAAVLLWLTRPLLYRIGRVHWPVRAVIAVLCLFVVPVSLFAPGFPAAETPEPDPAAMPSSPLAQNVAGSGVIAPYKPPLLMDASGFALSFADKDTFSANAAAGAVSADAPVPAGDGGTTAAARSILLWVLPLIWAAGMALAFLYSAVSYWRFAVRLKRSSRAVTDDAMLEGLRAAQKKSGVARLPGLRCIEAIASPLAMGILRPCIYLPAGIPADASLDYALQHECVHLRKGHLFWKLAAQLVCAVHWFDPAVWLLARLLNEACEFECDRAVSAALDGAQKCGYCTALLDAADSGRMPRCVSAFSRPSEILRKRIEAVLAPEPRLFKRIISIALCAALVFCAAGMTACAAGQAAESMASQLPVSLPDDASKPDQAQEDESGPKEDPTPEDDSTTAPENSVQPLWSGIGEGKPDETAAEWIWPVPNMKYITTRFTEDYHQGVDIAASRYEAILAVKGGTVSIAEYHHGYGNYVEIDHGDGWKSRYAHCSILLVQAGDTVSAGQMIACVGSTGMATGNCCHLELFQDETPVDPFSVFDADPTVWTAQGTSVAFRYAGSYAESKGHFDVIAEILGDDASFGEWDRFEQNARFWQVSFRKPVTVLNEQKGEAYVTLFLCEYEDKLYICAVPEYGFTEADGWKRISDIFVDVVNSGETQKLPEVTVGANFLNGDETGSTLITSTFVITTAEES